MQSLYLSLTKNKNKNNLFWKISEIKVIRSFESINSHRLIIVPIFYNSSSSITIINKIAKIDPLIDNSLLRLQLPNPLGESVIFKGLNNH